MCASCTGCSPTPSSRPPSRPELRPRVRRAAACPARALRLCRPGPCAAMRGTSRRDLRRQRDAGGSEEASMRYIPALMGMTAALALTSLAMAAEVPGSPDQVAEPGGSLPGDPKIALVKVADGLQRSDQRRQRRRRLRAHLRGRARRPHQGRQRGRQRAGRSVPRPHHHQPARQRRADRLRRAGPLRRRVPPELRRERLLLRPLRVAAVQRRRHDRALPGRSRRART